MGNAKERDRPPVGREQSRLILSHIDNRRCAMTSATTSAPSTTRGRQRAPSSASLTPHTTPHCCSIGETGAIQNRTIFRITPRNVTGIQNKDTGDAPGDVGFMLSKKNLTQAAPAIPETQKHRTPAGNGGVRSRPDQLRLFPGWGQYLREVCGGDEHRLRALLRVQPGEPHREARHEAECWMGRHQRVHVRPGLSLPDATGRGNPAQADHA